MKLKKRKKNFYINYDSTNLNKKIFLTKSKFNKSKSTSQFKRILKKRELTYKNNLTYVVYFGGFSTSLKEAKHLILKGKILVNNNVINSPNLNVKNGDIIINNNNLSLFSYYDQRWNSMDFKYKKNNKIRYLYKVYKYKIKPIKFQRISFNSIVII